MEVEVLQQLFFDAGTDAIAEQYSVRYHHGGTGGEHLTLGPSPQSGEGMLPQLPHDELEEEEGGFGRLLIFGEIALDAFLFLAAEGRVCEDDVHAVALADVGEFEAQGVAGVDLRRVEAVQHQVHLAEEVGQRLGFAAEEGFLLQDFAVGHGLHLLAEVVVGFNQEAAGAAGGVEDGLP